MSLIKIDPVKIQAKANASRIAELKSLLIKSDYKVLPDYDKNNVDIKPIAKHGVKKFAC